MSWAPQRLPITLTPVPGEGLDSWIEAYAQRLRVCSSDLLNDLGLSGSTLTHMVTILTEPERRTLSTATGIHPDALTLMTLQPFDGIAVTIDPARRTTGHPPAWRRHTGSRFCPACLRDSGGRWQLAWRLPWAFACPIHACLLADYCPDCGKRPAPHRAGTRGSATIPGACTVRISQSTPGGWRAPTCGHPLTQMRTHTLPSGGRVIAAQRHLHQLITTGSRTAEPDRQRIRGLLNELHVLAYKSLDALHAQIEPPSLAHDVVNECGKATLVPKQALDSYDAHTVAVATTLAVAARPDAAGDSVLTWIITADRRRRTPPEPCRILQPFTNTSPGLIVRLLHALDPHLQVHDRLVYASAGRRPHRPNASDEQIHRRAASLPTLLWPDWTLRLIPTDKVTHNAVTSLRAGLAAMVLLPGTRLSGRHAVALLGSYIRAATAKATLTHLPEPQRTVSIAILTDLAESLDANPAPINYTRRRDLFSTPAVDRAAYTTLATTRGWRPASPVQLRLLDDCLAVLLTGTRPDHHTTRMRSGTADAWNPLTLALPTPVRTFVRDQAQLLLRQHSIDEPVTWQPAASKDYPWPGIDPDTINPDQFADAFGAHASDRDGLRLICHATGLRGIQVRLYPHIVDLPMPEHQWEALSEHPHGNILAPATVRQLYHEQRMSMMDIARLARTTEKEVRHALTGAGITPRKSGANRRPIPLSWLQDRYVGSGKTVEQAAAEAGVCRNTFAKYARLHNIPTIEHARAVHRTHDSGRSAAAARRPGSSH